MWATTSLVVVLESQETVNSVSGEEVDPFPGGPCMPCVRTFFFPPPPFSSLNIYLFIYLWLYWAFVSV